MNRPSHAVYQLCAAAFWILTAALPARASDPAIDRRVDSLLRLMTLEEKLGQLNQRAGEATDVPGERVSGAQLAELRKGHIGSFLNVVGAAETRRVQKVAVEESRLHIPLLFGLDVIHGYRTTFPIPLAEASTWDTALIGRSARAAALEATAAGVHWTFAPMVDIARDPRWGRIAEGSGEDPLLGSAMAAARVRGFQGAHLNDPASLLACAKHFAAYGAAEGGRDYNTADLSERTLREVYLEPFHAAVNAGAGTLMSAFNDLNGVPASGNRWLLTDLLRGTWGFGGFVVSDWGAVEELQAHGVAGTRTDAGILAITAGVDMDMMSGIYAGELRTAVQSGMLPEAVVDQAVRRVLRMKFAAGLFGNPYRGCDTAREARSMLTAENLLLAREVAARSMVLLKNTHGLLPLGPGVRTLAVIGPLADNAAEMLGPWAAEGKAGDVVTVLGGVRKRFAPTMTLLHAGGCLVSGDSALDIDGAVRTAARADAVLLVVGESADMSGEAASRASLNLPGRQSELVRAVCGTGKPVILILLNGRPLTVEKETAMAEAVVEAWFPGVQGGNALAAILAGDVNPSGKLPVTFPREVGQLPVYYNHRTTGRPFSAVDHFTSKYIDVVNTPLFPFGFGLSYTTFAYSDLTLEPGKADSSATISVSVTVANTGDRTGRETVQLYIRDDVASVTRPVKELKAFLSVELAAGEARRVRFPLRVRDLGCLDRNLVYTVEPGSFTVYVGGNSAECLSARFEVTGR